MDQAILNGTPLPPLAPAAHYGQYVPLMTFIHDGYAKLVSLNTEIVELSKGQNTFLHADSLLSPATRKAEHEKLARLIAALGETAETQERLGGPSSEKLYMAMPGDETFKRKLAKGMGQHQDQIIAMKAALTLKQAYYQKVDEIITLADLGAASLSPSGKLAFHLPGQGQEYNRRVAELVAMEQTMNSGAKRLQNQTQELIQKARS
jgi:hypothetical protein